MTVETTVDWKQYSTNGTTGPWTVPFYFLNDTDVEVTYTDANGNDATLALNVDYTISGVGDPNGGAVYTTTAYTADGLSKITLRRVPSMLQQTDLVDGDAFPADTVEKNMDLDAMRGQYLARLISRALLFPVSDETSGALPSPQARANKQLVFDGVGRPTFSTPASGTAADFLVQLLGLADPTQGAAMVALNQTLAYASFTLGAKLQQVLCPLDYPWGAKGDSGVTDDSAALAAFFAAVPSGSIVELAGREYGLYPTVTGTSSGDAIALNAIPRLYNKKGITIRNGRIFAVNPGATGTRIHFPTTLTIDGCTGIALLNSQIEAKGDGYGNADASAGLDSEGRRTFLAQNGGHALVVIRSSRVYADAACRFVRAGSTGAFYSSSSDDVHCAGYASAMSLGYAGFAVDSWCGGSAVSGFSRHRLYLKGATVDANGGTYSSKACVTGEDLETFIYIDGGVYKDAYANGSSHQLGAAFSANSCHVYVDGANVENCASIGLTTHSTGNEAKLECAGVNAKGLRTSMHIIDNVSFGTDNVKYVGCNAEIVGGSTWSEPELSVPTVVANMKVTSIANVDIIGCETTGAHTFSMNTKACYGGIEVSGGKHTVTDRIFDSAGWGGASAGSSRGYVMKAVKFFVFLANTAVVSTAKSVATQAIIAIVDEDSSSRFTFQYVDFARDVVVESNLMREFISVSDLSGGGTLERRFLGQRLIACYQATNTAGDNYASGVKVVTYNGITGSNSSVTLTLLDNKKPSAGFIIDDTGAARKFVGTLSGPNVVGTQLQITMAITGTTNNLTPTATYATAFAG